ncbi:MULTISPECIES: basic amino acid ABC transporter substrate-binding protein [Bacillus]|uniref:basic amino acid ABC transporter substrate-binding protein n=1 Tax=Bacillus TaxID=1386 RepID=UPI000300FA51|nr:MULTISPECIES: basic amino acid ABC transporter substrate-binding protein [Bacillus]
MKKIMIGIMLTCAFLLVLTGCGTSDEKSGGDKGKETLRIVTDAAFAPMEYLDKDQVKGFDVDFSKAVAEEAGYDVKIDHVGWDPMFVELENDRAQMAVAAITIDEDRQKTYDFSVPYFISTLEILVPEGSPIKSAKDLKGKTVAVQSGTTGMIAAEKYLGKNNKNIKKFESNNLAILELTKGGADAVIADNIVVEEYVKNNPKDKLVVIEDRAGFESEFYGILFNKGNTELKEKIDKAINTILDNGKYEEIYKKWFGKSPDIDFLKKQQE